jgi:hypothetical protein
MYPAHRIRSGHHASISMITVATILLLAAATAGVAQHPSAPAVDAAFTVPNSGQELINTNDDAIAVSPDGFIVSIGSGAS